MVNLNISSLDYHNYGIICEYVTLRQPNKDIKEEPRIALGTQETKRNSLTRNLVQEPVLAKPTFVLNRGG